ncbi:hypothetical protein Tco_1047299 [Tanacetum coccineum]
MSGLVQTIKRFCITYDVHHHLDASTSTSTATIYPHHDTSNSRVVMWMHSAIFLKLVDMVIDDSRNWKPNPVTRNVLEDIHVTWTQFREKWDKIAALHEVASKNCIQCLETTLQFLTTLSELIRDAIKKFVTASERNRLNKILKDSAKRRCQDPYRLVFRVLSV